MKVVFYRDQDGNIGNCHGVPDDWSEAELQDRVNTFNAQAPTPQAYIEDIKDGSLEQFLFMKFRDRKKDRSEAIRCALEAIQEAEDAVESLRQ